MVIDARDKEIQKIFTDKERLLKEQPELGHSYRRFLRDWEKYQKVSKKVEKSHDYLVFGASFKE